MTSELKRQATLGVGWSLLDRTLSKTVGFIVFLGMTSLLNPRDFGLVAMAKAIPAMLRPFVTQGTGPAIVQRSALEPQHRDSAFWLNLGVGGLAAASVVVLAGPISSVLGEQALGSVLGVLGLQLLVEGLGTTHASLLERELSFKPLAIRALVAEIVGGIVGLGMAAQGFGLWSLVGQALARQSADTAALWLVTRWRPGTRFSWTHARELLSYGYGAMGSSLVGAARGPIEQLLIGALLGARSLGYYVVAVRFIGELGNLLTGSVGEVAFPTFSRLQADRQKLIQAFLKAVEYTAFLAFPAFLVLAAVAPELIPISIGPRWIPSVPVIRALVLAGLVGAVGKFTRSMIAANGKPAWNISLGLLDLSVGVLAIWLAAPFGLVTVAFASALSTVIGFSSGLWLVHRMLSFQIRSYLGSIDLALGAALAMTVLVVLVGGSLMANTGVLARLILSVTAGGAFYAGVVGLLRPRLIREILDLGLIVLPIRRSRDS